MNAKLLPNYIAIINSNNWSLGEALKICGEQQVHNLSSHIEAHLTERNANINKAQIQGSELKQFVSRHNDGTCMNREDKVVITA